MGECNISNLAIQRRRGSTAEHATFTGLLGEITVDTTKNTAVVHDGSTAGGFPLALESNWVDEPITNGVNITWGTAEPATPTYIFRYRVDGKTCFVNIYITSADGNAASSLAITLPVAPKDNNAFSTLTGLQLVDTTWNNSMPYINDGASVIGFYNFSICTNAVACKFIITGQYEIA